eukprot:Hpha_TRINITY_DN15710_c2_g8::TRINITY_DN15710_c2_g8_i1::g.41669::m.41669
MPPAADSFGSSDVSRRTRGVGSASAARHAVGGGPAIQQLARELEDLQVPPQQAARLAEDAEPILGADSGLAASDIVERVKERVRKRGGSADMVQAGVYRQMYHMALSMRVDDKLRFNRELNDMRRNLEEIQAQASAQRLAKAREHDLVEERHVQTATGLADTVAGLRRENTKLQQILAQVEDERDHAFEQVSVAEELAAGAKRELQIQATQRHKERLQEQRAQEQRASEQRVQERAREKVEEEPRRKKRSASKQADTEHSLHRDAVAAAPVADHSHEVQRLREEVRHLRDERLDSDRQFNEMRRQLTGAVSERDDAQDQLAEARSSVIEHKRELASEREALRDESVVVQRRADDVRTEAKQEVERMQKELSRLSSQVVKHSHKSAEAKDQLSEFQRLFEVKLAEQQRQFETEREETQTQLEKERSRADTVLLRQSSDFVTIRAHNEALADERRKSEKRVSEAQSSASREIEGCEAASRKILAEGERHRLKLQAELNASQQEVALLKARLLEAAAAERAAQAENSAVAAAQLHGKAQALAMVEEELEQERKRRTNDQQRQSLRMDDERRCWAENRRTETEVWEVERQQLRDQVREAEALAQGLVRRERQEWEQRLEGRDAELSTALATERQRSRAELDSARTAAELERRRIQSEHVAEREQWAEERAQMTHKLRSTREAADAEAGATVSRIRNELDAATQRAITAEKREKELQELSGKYLQIIAVSKDQLREYQNLFQVAEHERGQLKLQNVETRAQASSARAALLEKRKVLSEKEDALHHAMMALRHRNMTVEEMQQASHVAESELRVVQLQNEELHEALRLQEEVLDEEEQAGVERERLRRLEEDVAEERHRARRHAYDDEDDAQARAALERMEQLLAATPAELIGRSGVPPASTSGGTGVTEEWEDERHAMQSHRRFSQSSESRAQWSSVRPARDPVSRGSVGSQSGPSSRWIGGETSARDLQSGIGVDLTGDGRANAIGYDTTGDGRIDALDTNFDGQIDTRLSAS